MTHQPGVYVPLRALFLVLDVFTALKGALFLYFLYRGHYDMILLASFLIQPAQHFLDVIAKKLLC